MKKEYFLVAAVAFTILCFYAHAPVWMQYGNVIMTVMLFIQYTFGWPIKYRFK